MLKNWSEDGRTSISPDESNRQPADTENISALDQLSTAKVQQNSETAKVVIPPLCQVYKTETSATGALSAAIRTHLPVELSERSMVVK